MSDAQNDSEIEALNLAYQAISSQPSEAWDRMFQWLRDRANADRRRAPKRRTADSRASSSLRQITEEE